MRIAYLCNHDPDNPISISGMPYSIKQQLVKRAEVINVLPARGMGNQKHDQRRAKAMGLLPDFIKKPARSIVRSVRGTTPQATEIPAAVMIANAEEDSRQATEQVKAGDFDLVFVALSKSLLYCLETDLPVVYFSDATAHMINTTYPKKMAMSESWRNADDQLEQAAFDHVDLAILPSSIAANSAREHYGFDNTVIIPMGANQPPESFQSASIPEPPTKEDIRLVITAADPVRKRLELAVDIVGELCRRGWNATLNYVGPHHPCTSAPHVHHVGHLLLNDPADRATYWQTVANAHFKLLPTLGDAFALSAVEAACVGTPGIVSDTGGLREVVLDGETGRVLPKDAPLEDYATAIEEFSADPEAYTKACHKARDRAVVVFTWDHFGECMWERIEELRKGARSSV